MVTLNAVHDTNPISCPMDTLPSANPFLEILPLPPVVDIIESKNERDETAPIHFQFSIPNQRIPNPSFATEPRRQVTLGSCRLLLHLAVYLIDLLEGLRLG